MSELSGPQSGAASSPPDPALPGNVRPATEAGGQEYLILRLAGERHWPKLPGRKVEVLVKRRDVVTRAGC